jgi:hypothetical protein
MHRVLRPKGQCVLLTTRSRMMHTSLQKLHDKWILVAKYFVNIGGLEGWIFHLEAKWKRSIDIKIKKLKWSVSNIQSLCRVVESGSECEFDAVRERRQNEVQLLTAVEFSLLFLSHLTSERIYIRAFSMRSSEWIKRSWLTVANPPNKGTIWFSFVTLIHSIVYNSSIQYYTI